MGAQRAGGWSALGLVVILGWVGGATAVFDLSEIPMMGCAADGLCDVVMTDGRRIETPQVRAHTSPRASDTQQACWSEGSQRARLLSIPAAK